MNTILKSLVVGTVALCCASEALAQDSERRRPANLGNRNSQRSETVQPQRKSFTDMRQRQDSQPRQQGESKPARPASRPSAPAPSTPATSSGGSGSRPRPSQALPRAREALRPVSPSPQIQTPSDAGSPSKRFGNSTAPRVVTGPLPREETRRPASPALRSSEPRPSEPRPSEPRPVEPRPSELRRSEPEKFRVPTNQNGPRPTAPRVRESLLNTQQTPRVRDDSPRRVGTVVDFPDQPRVDNPGHGSDWHDDRHDHGHDWHHWDRHDWHHRPVVYVPRHAHVVLGCDPWDRWDYSPSYCRPYYRHSVWCDPCDNLFVSAYRPSWRWGWSSWSGLSFSYSSYSSSSSFSLGYAPLVVPAYSSAYCGSALLWNRPSVIYGVGWGASRWYPGTYINNVNVIGAGSDQYDPALNPSLSSSMNLPAVASTVTEADPVTMPVSELDRAAEAMQENQFGVAVEWLRSYLRNSPGDAKAMRWLSVALLANRNADDAAAMMRMAYSSDPALAGEPINRYELGLNNTELRDLVIRAGEYANSHDTGSSWLLVGVLMQAEGRASLAKTMFDRAAAAGCDPEIVNRLKAYTN